MANSGKLLLCLFSSFLVLCSCSIFRKKKQPEGFPPTIKDRNGAQIPNDKKRNAVCLERIVVYEDEHFTRPAGEDVDTALVKQIAKEVLQQKLIEAGFEVKECTSNKGEQWHLDLGAFHRVQWLKLKHTIEVRVRVYDEPISVNPEGWFFEILAKAGISSDSNDAIRETAMEISEKIVMVLKEKLKPQTTP